MFGALIIGILEDLKSCLRKRANVNGRNANSSTSLLFAAQGPSIEALKFIADQDVDDNIKDEIGQSALHVAAAQGRKNIVEFTIRKIGLSFDDPDKFGKSCSTCCS